MKKIVIGICLFLFCLAVSFGAIFNNEADAQNYASTILNNKIFTLEITDVNAKLGTDIIKVYWFVKVDESTTTQIDICDENNQSCISVNQTKVSNIHESPEMYSSFVDGVENSEIAQVIKNQAKNYLKEWKNNQKIRKYQSLIGQTQTIVI